MDASSSILVAIDSVWGFFSLVYLLIVLYYGPIAERLLSAYFFALPFTVLALRMALFHASLQTVDAALYVLGYLAALSYTAREIEFLWKLYQGLYMRLYYFRNAFHLATGAALFAAILAGVLAVSVTFDFAVFLFVSALTLSQFIFLLRTFPAGLKGRISLYYAVWHWSMVVLIVAAVLLASFLFWYQVVPTRMIFPQSFEALCVVMSMVKPVIRFLLSRFYASQRNENADLMLSSLSLQPAVEEAAPVDM
ncbi:hypothetical protein BDY21DRAFT_358826 [Lineolata rhizophorae]|uniref:Uncharacterized protein n=1 Tax=Lineolata rhizophorae TaxID=578093 RepID=A0A6A6NLK3_9PEZI|nr:hypothetical protein BDY21DRAFT_358826 [Lineolata rhizophorae]